MTFALLFVATQAIGAEGALSSLRDFLPDGLGTPEAPPASTCERPPRDVVVGYEPGTPLTERGDATRAMRVLESAFPAPCHRLVLRSYHRDDLAPSLSGGRIDLGVVGIPAAASHAAPGVTSLPARQTEGVDTLMLHPASYSVVSTKATGSASSVTLASSPWLLIVGGALAGVALLTACLYLLNFRLPRFNRLFVQATTRLNPGLTGLRRTLEWLYGNARGRLLTLLWAALGAAVSLQMLSARALMDEAAPAERDYQRGAELAAYPGRQIYELRDGRWKKCLRPFECLRNYEQGHTLALAGDRDVLCHFAEEHAAELSFRSDVAVPMLYAFLLPAGPSEAAAAPSAKEAVLQALRAAPYAGSPWRPCEAAMTTARNERR